MGLGRFERIHIARHEYPGLRDPELVQTVNEVAEREGLRATPFHAKELDQVGGLGEHEQHAAGRPVGILGERARRRRVLQPLLEFFLRSEEHTSELQSLMRISSAVFCLKKKNMTNHMNTHLTHTD